MISATQSEGIILKDSLDAMILEAKSQGWLSDNNIAIIPEIANVYDSASKYFLETILNGEPEATQTMTFYVCRYLFVKGVEGVVLWGMSSNGLISVYFDHNHLFDDIQTDLPEHLHNEVTSTLTIGESLFFAHQKYVLYKQRKNLANSFDDTDISREVELAVNWIPRFGITYAINRGYDAMR